MRGWSFPIGRVLGVEIRIHSFFLILLGFSISFGIYTSDNGGRGFLLWCMLVAAVIVREAARGLAAACYGLELRSLLLLPTGGLPTYASTNTYEKSPEDAIQKRMTFVGPAANLVCGGILAAVVAAVSPEINLFARPWVTPASLMKAFIWVNILLGLVNLLPATPLDGGRLVPGGFNKPGANGLLSFGQMIAVGLVLLGVLTGGVWFVMIGFFVMFGSHMENQGLLLQTSVETVTMRDVMLTDYSTLSASDTLEDALERAIHTLQDVFPVVRGGTIVGAVSRQSILEALQAGGNSYVQGVMARTFEIAHPEDALVQTLRRIAGTGGTQFVPVLEGERVVGIVTPHHLSQSIRLRSQLPRRGRERDER